MTAASAALAFKAGVWFRRGRLACSLLIRRQQRACSQAETPLMLYMLFVP